MITWAERVKAAVSQTGQGGTAKTDETPVSRVLAVSSVPDKATSALLGRLSTVLAVRSPAVLEKHDPSIPVIEDPDRWCWPHSSAMNGAEIDTFAARLHKFTDKGLPRTHGEALADKLVLRDRDQDDRRICLECKHLTGYGVDSWRCGNWQAAAVANCSRDAQLASDLVVLPQRCDGFAAHLKLTS